MQDVRAFVDKVRNIMTHLEETELGDTEFMFQWLFEQFIAWTPIREKIEKIRESPLGSHRRIWTYLWGAINRKIFYCHEDENRENVAKLIASGDSYAVVSRGKGDNHDREIDGSEGGGEWQKEEGQGH